MLHGYGSTGKSFEIAGVPGLLDEGISEGEIPLCIMIFPSDGHPQKAGWWSGAYAQMLNEDLVREVDRTLRTVDSREYRFLAGESMGGYGAVVNGLNHTDTFGNIAEFSGALGIADAAEHLTMIRMENVFGPGLKLFEDGRLNPFRLAEQVLEEERPRIFMCCGSEDRLLEVNQRFYEAIKDSYDVTVKWGDGAHEYQYWNERLKDMFVWFCEADMKNGFFMGRDGNDFC
jgi:enterochelin esterase-like enzyme